MSIREAIHVAKQAGILRYARVDLESAKRVLEDLLANIELTLATAPSEMVRETGQ